MLHFYPIVKKNICLFYNKYFLLNKKIFISSKKIVVQPLYIFLILFSAVVTIVTFVAINFIVELANDPELLELIPYHLLHIILALPILLIYINILILLPVVIAKIKKKPGTLLRFRIVNFLFIAITVPAIVFAFFFVQIFNFTLESFNHPLLLKKMRENMKVFQLEISKKMEKVEKETFVITQQKEKEKENFSIKNLYLDEFFYYHKQGHIKKIGNGTSKKFQHFDYFKKINIQLLLSLKKNYTSYEDSLGFIYSIVQKNKNTYAIGIKIINFQKQQKIHEVLSILKQLRQLDLLVGPLKFGVLIILLYFYAQIFCAMVIISYYFSNRYLAPLQDLILTIRTLSLKERSITFFSDAELKKLLKKLDLHVKKMNKDELRNLLKSFNELIFELQQNRIRIARISEIEGWQEVAKRIAHEIKNPLTPIKLATSQIEKILAKENLNAYEQLLPSLNLINHEVEHISKLTDDFSYFSKSIELKKEWSNLSKILKNIEDFLQQRQDVKFKISIAKIPLIYVDHKKIHQLLLNLVKNSLESLDESKIQKKKIFLYANIVNIEKKYFVEIHVVDNGPGIAKKEKEKIFKPYFTLKKEGTGLGLAICQQIALAHNAEIFLKKRKKHLVCFTLRLPLKKKKKNPIKIN